MLPATNLSQYRNGTAAFHELMLRKKRRSCDVWTEPNDVVLFTW